MQSDALMWGLGTSLSRKSLDYSEAPHTHRPSQTQAFNANTPPIPNLVRNKHTQATFVDTIFTPMQALGWELGA